MGLPRQLNSRFLDYADRFQNLAIRSAPLEMTDQLDPKPRTAGKGTSSTRAEIGLKDSRLPAAGVSFCLDAERGKPQRLKPQSIMAPVGTSEDVPFPDAQVTRAQGFSTTRIVSRPATLEMTDR
jgi:hypothetical protein